MSWWQAYAIFLGAVIPLAALVGIIRIRRWSQLVLLAQIALPLEVGTIAYAIKPGSEPQISPLLWLALALVVVDLIVLGWTIHRRRVMLRGPISVAQLDRATDWARASRLLTILVVTALLLDFEPWLGIATLAANAVWTCLWIPRRMRAYGIGGSVEIAASPHDVFKYLVDPATWPLYRSASDMRLVSVDPPGPLAAGSRMVSLMSVNLGRHVKPYRLKSTTEVTEMTPERSYSTVWLDRPSEQSTTVVEAMASGARLHFRLAGVQPFWPAAMGAMLEVRGILAARRADAVRNFTKLKEILEAPVSR